MSRHNVDGCCAFTHFNMLFHTTACNVGQVHEYLELPRGKFTLMTYLPCKSESRLTHAAYRQLQP